MYRNLLSELLRWKDAKTRMPLLVRGARQVGKSHLVRMFAKAHFKTLLEVNFELSPELKLAFKTLQPEEIISRLYLQTGVMLRPGESILFLDEIQECTAALEALRYFKEQMPELHVVAAGSLLEFAINSERVRMPVGRIDMLFLKPLSFEEYLLAMGHTELLEHMQQADLNSGVDPVAHERLCEHLRYYFFLGGMPAIINEYKATHDFERVQARQTNLMQTYRDDFGKYAAKTKHELMQLILSRAPGIVSEKFMYSKIDSDLRAREIKVALEYLVNAGLLHKVRYTSASGLPLASTAVEKKFKIIFLDIGLLNCNSQLSPNLFIETDLILLNRGIQAEQFVGQELLAYAKPYLQQALFYWDRERPSSSAEVDYVINIDERIIPIEVKAGRTGRLRSLQLFLDERQAEFGIRLSLKPLGFENRVLSVPLYLINQLPRLVKATRCV